MKLLRVSMKLLIVSMALVIFHEICDFLRKHFRKNGNFYRDDVIHFDWIESREFVCEYVEKVICLPRKYEFPTHCLTLFQVKGIMQQENQIVRCGCIQCQCSMCLHWLYTYKRQQCVFLISRHSATIETTSFHPFAFLLIALHAIHISIVIQFQ